MKAIEEIDGPHRAVPHAPDALRRTARLHRGDHAGEWLHGRAAVGLVRWALATAAPGIMYAGNRPITVTRLRITDIGRQMLAGM
jgi:hypothetical protein